MKIKTFITNDFTKQVQKFINWKKFLKVLAIWEKMCYNKTNKQRKGRDTNGK